MAHGLAQVLSPKELIIVVNTGDDFEHFGLHIAPDLDTVMYTLAGLENPNTGWGIIADSTNCMTYLSILGEEDWFTLGDKDLAAHLVRTQLLRAGQMLSQVTAQLCQRLGVRHRVLPMCETAFRTKVVTDVGVLDFQDYFVRRKAQPKLQSIYFEHASNVAAQAQFAVSLAEAKAIVICPSNPLLSVQPILALPGVRAALAQRQVPVIAVSPIVGGKAIKGPAAKIFAELGFEPSPLAVAEYYGDLIDGIVIDHADAQYQSRLRERALDVLMTDTIMKDRDARQRLAREVVAFAATCSRH